MLGQTLYLNNSSSFTQQIVSMTGNVFQVMVLRNSMTGRNGEVKRKMSSNLRLHEYNGLNQCPGELTRGRLGYSVGKWLWAGSREEQRSCGIRFLGCEGGRIWARFLMCVGGRKVRKKSKSSICGHIDAKPLFRNF
jgi:hypothetical protein